MKQTGKMRAFIQDQLEQGVESPLVLMFRGVEKLADADLENIGMAFCRMRNDCLMDAVRKDDLAGVNAWVVAGAQPHRQGKKQKPGDPTALSIAEKKGNADIIGILKKAAKK